MDLTDRQQGILRHLARYEITLRPVLDRLFYDGRRDGCEPDLQALSQQGYLASQANAIPEPTDPSTLYSYYHLTRKACRAIGASESRCRNKGGESLSRALAFLWFCVMKDRRRHRLETRELADIFGVDSTFHLVRGAPAALKLHGYHCLDQEPSGRFRVLNLYATKTSPTETLRELRKRIEEVRQVEVLEQALEAHEYGFAVLAPSVAMRDSLHRQLLEARPKLGALCLVTVAPHSWRR